MSARWLLTGAAIGAGMARMLWRPRRQAAVQNGASPADGDDDPRLALHRLEQRFAVAQRIGRVGTWELDPSTGDLWWSEEVYRIFGLQPDTYDPSPESFSDVAHPEDRAKVRSALDVSLSVRRTVAIEYRILRPDGTLRWVERRGASVVDTNGRTVRILGTVRDMTERRRHEERRRESEERYRLLFDRNPVPLLIFDDETLQFLDVNEAAVRQYGWTREEFLGMSIRDIRPPEEVEPLLAARLTHGSGFQRVEGEWHHVRKDGSVIDIEIVRYRFESGGRYVQLALVIDVTAQRRAEKALVEAREEAERFAGRLQEAIEAERTRISREIHDELGQALTGIRMQAASIESRLAQDPELRAMAANMSRLLDQTVRTVRRISTELRPGILDAFGLVAALEWAVHDFTDRCGIAAVFTDRLDFAPRLSGESDIHVFRIVQEALTNVARHAGANRVEVDIGPIEDGFEVTIRDDGRGFDAGQEHGVISLGLLGMRERARLLGGTLEMRSRPGAGTEITLRVPASIMAAGRA